MFSCCCFWKLKPLVEGRMFLDGAVKCLFSGSNEILDMQSLSQGLFFPSPGAKLVSRVFGDGGVLGTQFPCASRPRSRNVTWLCNAHWLCRPLWFFFIVIINWRFYRVGYLDVRRIYTRKMGPVALKSGTNRTFLPAYVNDTYHNVNRCVFDPCFYVVGLRAPLTLKQEKHSPRPIATAQQHCVNFLNFVWCTSENALVYFRIKLVQTPYNVV